MNYIKRGQKCSRHLSSPFSGDLGVRGQESLIIYFIFVLKKYYTYIESQNLALLSLFDIARRGLGVKKRGAKWRQES